MIHWDSSKKPGVVRWDEMSLDLGERQQIDAYTWTDDNGHRHIVLHPSLEEVRTLPRGTKRVAFSLCWLFARMTATIEADRNEAEAERS